MPQQRHQARRSSIQVPAVIGADNGCLGSTTGCTPTTPTSALSTGSGIATSGSHIYVNGGGFSGYLSYLTFALAPPPPPPPPPATPSLSGLSVSPHRSSIAGRKVNGHCVKPTKKNKAHKSCQRPIHLKVRYKLNVAAAITFTLQAESPGRKVKGKCAKQTPKNDKHHTRCTLTKKISGSLTTAGTAGSNAFTLNGKIPGPPARRRQLRANRHPDQRQAADREIHDLRLAAGALATTRS